MSVSENEEDPLPLARQLYAGRFRAYLSTHSQFHEGYPFGSAVPYCLGRDGCPLLLLSHLSQHTRNMEADSRCGFLLVSSEEGDVQQSIRLSAVADVKLVEKPTVDDEETWFRYFPDTLFYYQELNFRFYRLEPLHFHYNGGFATARWLGRERLVLPNTLDAATEKRILDHMNQDHPEVIAGFLGNTGVALDAQLSPEMVGMDCNGLDIRAGEALYRIPLPRTLEKPEDARAILVEMTYQ